MGNRGGGSGRLAATAFKCLVATTFVLPRAAVPWFNEFMPGSGQHITFRFSDYSRTPFVEFVPGRIEHPVIISLEFLFIFSTVQEVVCKMC